MTISRRATRNATDLRKKLVIIGDGACGKTSLLMFFRDRTFHTDYIPTVFENYVVPVPYASSGSLDTGAGGGNVPGSGGVGVKKIELSLWDTAGQEDYDRLRPLSYPDTDVILICFALDNRNSFENVTEKWYPEAKHFCEKVPKLLVGLKLDLRDAHYANQEISRIVSTEEGVKLAERIKAPCYLECSAKTGQGVSEVFDSAVHEAMKGKATLMVWRRNKACVLL